MRAMNILAAFLLCFSVFPSAVMAEVEKNHTASYYMEEGIWELWFSFAKRTTR